MDLRKARSIVSKLEQIDRLEKELAHLLRGNRSPATSPEARERLELQGRYMGTVKGLSATEKARIKQIRLSEGIQKAIREAEKLRTH